MLLDSFSYNEQKMNKDCENCHGFDMDGDTGEPICWEVRKLKHDNGVNMRDFELFMVFGDRPRCPLRVKDYYDDT